MFQKSTSTSHVYVYVYAELRSVKPCDKRLSGTFSQRNQNHCVTLLLGGYFLFSLMLRLLGAFSSDLLKAFLSRAMIGISTVAHRVCLLYLLDVLDGLKNRLPVLEQRERHSLTFAVGHKIYGMLVFIGYDSPNLCPQKSHHQPQR